MDKKKCWDCFNFKTKVLTEESFVTSPFSDSESIKKYMEKYNGKVQIWWCKVGALRKRVICCPNNAKNAHNLNCRFREE